MGGGDADRMSDAEGVMWRLENDPFLTSTIASISVLDRPLDFERFLRTMDRAAHVIPRLRQRVQAAPGGLAPPRWVEDPSFDLRHHVRRVALPAPGCLAQLEDYATLLVSDPFDRVRPLWEFVVVEGLEGGRAALVQKAHHTITDGERAMRLWLEFVDFERDVPEREPVVAGPAATGEGTNLDFVRELGGALRLPVAVLRQVRELVAEPSRIPGAGAAVAATVRSLVAQLAETDRARSPLWGARSLRRSYTTLSVPLEPVRTAAKSLGATVNAAFLAALAAAAGDYHRRHGAPVEELRASMAVSTRTDASGANAFSLTRLLVPTAEMAMAERVALVTEATAAARAAAITNALDALAALASTLPTPILTRVARTQAQTVDFATSNVRAASAPIYIGGARVLETYAMGPLVGVALNATMMSYCGSLAIGLHCDAAAVRDETGLREAVKRGFDQLVVTTRD